MVVESGAVGLRGILPGTGQGSGRLPGQGHSTCLFF